MLPVHLYRGEDALRADRDRVLRRSWQFLGHDSQVPTTGDYLADVIGGAPVVVVRKADGVLAAFHNVCRHRAGALVADGAGNCGEAFTCRYHGWKYALDGRLRNAVDFGALDGFDPRDYGLFPIRVEVWRGLLFVNLDPDAAPLSRLIAPLAGRWPEGQAALPLTERRSHRIACNWKAYVENYLEGYHLPMVHPEFDADIVVVPTGVIANNATSATLTMGTTGDFYYPAVFTTAIDIYAPEITALKTAVDINGGVLMPGDILEYTIGIDNAGGDGASEFVLSDNIPVWTNYVAGSLEVFSGANAGTWYVAQSSGGNRAFQWGFGKRFAGSG